MEQLSKKLDELDELIKANLMPTITQSKLPGRPKGTGVTKQPFAAPKANTGIKPPSQKNPVKVAEQISNPDTKDVQIKQAKEGLAINSRGQWSLKKEE